MQDKQNSLTIQMYLKTLYGVNVYRANLLAQKIGSSYNTKYKDLPDYKKDLLSQTLSHVRKQHPGLDADLKLHIKNTIYNLSEIQTTRGIKHRKGYPTRGQRTRSNAQTSKRLKIL